MQIERLIQMIFLLIRREYLTAQEMADYFEVSKRTILRDLDTLTLANIPIYTVKGRGGGIGILKEYTIDKTVFSKREQDKIMSYYNANDDNISKQQFVNFDEFSI